MILDFSKIFVLLALAAVDSVVNAGSACTSSEVGIDGNPCKVFSEQITAMKAAGVCQAKEPLKYESCQVDDPTTSIPTCITSNCEAQENKKFDDKCKTDCFVKKKASTCYEACSLCTDNSKGNSCPALKIQAKAMKDVCIVPPDFQLCFENVNLSEGMPQCLQCNPKKDMEFNSPDCPEKCFIKARDRDAATPQQTTPRMRRDNVKSDTECYEACSKCTDSSTQKTCDVLSKQAKAMNAAGVCKKEVFITQCEVIANKPKSMPDCLESQFTKANLNMQFDECHDEGCWDADKATHCLKKCFMDDKDRAEGAEQDTDCYRACIPEKCNSDKFGSDAKYGACNFVLEQSTAMKEANVCDNNEIITTICIDSTVNTAEIPPCLEQQCTAKDGFEFKGDCLDNCFKKAVVHNKQKDTDKNCYAGCSKPKPTTTTTSATTTTTAKDKKPSGVDPAVVPPVVPSNNQTLGNNSTAAPKPNAPNSNNSTGADAAFHVGQTLSFARMIFTALALVMAVKVIAA